MEISENTALTSQEEYALLKEGAKRKRELAKAYELIDIYHFKTVAGKKSEDIYYFDGVRYCRGGEVVIKREAEKAWKRSAKTNTVNELINRIKRLTYTEPEFFEPPINLINLLNGIYDITAKKFMPSNADYGFTWVMPVRYNSNADCPIIKKFLEETLYLEDLKADQQLTGYCLYRRYNIKRAGLYIGEPDSGKTVRLSLLTKFLGQKNVAGLTIQKIVNDKFAANFLRGKLANIYDDLPYEDLNNAGAFKSATGGGFIAAEEKWGDNYLFQSFAKVIFSCNQVPKIKDTEDLAFFYRWLLFRCCHIVEEKDPFLIDKLTTEQELSGYLNYALEGLYELLEKREFDYKLTPEEVKGIMLYNSEPLSAFAVDVLQEAPGEFCPKDLLERIYTRYCHKHRHTIRSKAYLTQNLNKYVKGFGSGQHVYNFGDGKKPKRVECYTGFLIKEEYLEMQDLQDFFYLSICNLYYNNITKELEKTPETPDSNEQVQEEEDVL